jgi:hypothetical protein
VDYGAGLGASHQTGWTGIVTKGIQLYGLLDAHQFLTGGKTYAFQKMGGNENVNADMPRVAG